VAGVDCSEESVSHGVHRVGQVGCAQDGVVHEGGRSGNHSGGDSRCGNNCGSNGRCGGNNSVVAETVAKTSKDDLSIGISLPLLVVVSMVMMVVQGRGTGDRDVGTVHTRGALEGQGVAVVTVVAVVSVVASVRVGAPLPAAGHSSTEVVGAETNVAGVDEASRGGSNSMNWVGKSRGAEDGRGGIGCSIGVTKTSKDHLSISLGFPLLPSKGPGSIGESSVGQGSSSTGHGQVQSVHARGALASEGVHSISIGDSESRVNHVGRGDGRNRGKNNKTLHDGVLVMQL